MSWGLLVLRLVVGLTVAAHGSQKLWGWFGGHGLVATGGFLEQLGFQPGRRAALMAGLAETVGGVSLALGALTPLGVALVIAVMIVAIVTVHIDKGFFNTDGGFEYPLLLAVTSLCLALTGPGAASVDAAFGLALFGLPWALAAMIVGALGAVVQLATRHRPPLVQPRPRPA